MSDQRRIFEANDEYGRAIAKYKQLVEQDGRSELRNDLAKCYLNRAIAYKKQGMFSAAIADFSKMIAMQWFIEAVRAGRSKKMLLKTAGRFTVHVEGNLDVLLKNGLDKGLWETFRRMLGETGRLEDE